MEGRRCAVPLVTGTTQRSSLHKTLASRFACDINRAGRLGLRQWVWKCHDMRPRCRERASQRSKEFVIGRIVRPKREHASRVEVRGQRLESLRLIKGRVARMEEIAR